MLSRARPALLLSTLALVALAACGSSEAVEPTEGDAITAGQLVAGDSPYYWADIPFDQHLTALAANLPAVHALLTDVAPSNDPMRLRMQAWADRYDAAMRARTGNTAAPKPVVQLVGSSKAYNAFAGSTYASVGAGLGPAAPESIPGIWPTLQNNGASNGFGMVPQSASYARPRAWNRLASLTQVWNLNNKAGQGCTLSPSGTRLVASGAQCQSSALRSGDVVLLATSPYLIVTSDFAADMSDESAMAFTIAHELGHLYRAHPSPLTVRKYGFWYEQGPNVAKRPLPADASAALELQYRNIQRTHTVFDDVAGAKFGSRARGLPMLLAVYTEASEAKLPAQSDLGIAACAGYPAWAQRYPFAKFLAEASTASSPSAEFSQAYLALESVVRSCTAPIKFSAASRGGEAKLIPTVFFSAFQDPMAQNLSVPLQPQDGQALSDYVTKVGLAATLLASTEKEFRAKQDANRVGVYTTEQEADEIAAELMIRAGFTRTQVLAAFLAVARAVDAKLPARTGTLPTGDAAASTCAAWMARDFVGDDGKPVAMTLGDLSDPHHGMCYRLYNLWRETGAHRYAPGAAPAALQPAWSTLVQHARQLSAAAKTKGL